MDDSKIGASTDVLVNTGSANKLPQYIATICATLGAFSLGTSLGWTSPAGPAFNNGTYTGDVISSDEQSWIGALMPLGAAVIAFPIGFLIDIFGRKWSMLGLVVFFILGWCLIIWPNGVAMIYAGRFIIGMAGGAFAVAAPCYTSEIAEKQIRGALGSYFQLMVTLGILFVYAVGAGVDLKVLSYICGVIPIVFAVTFFFMPESPVFLMSKDREEDARKSLKFFRGKHYNIDFEINEIRETIEKARREKLSFVEGFSTKAAKLGLVISLGLMLFQQFSGVNAVIFYTSQIFEAAGSDLDPNVSSIIVGVVQFVATFVSTLVVDRLGRKILLICSAGVMCICQLLLGVFFYLKDDGQDVKDIGWLPLLSLCLFMVAFSIGFGPIPWMMVSELFPPSTKGFASSLASCFNWILAFLVTKFFTNLSDAMGSGPTFWLFMAILAVGTGFVVFFVRETKGKTVEEIQRELGGGK